MGDIIPTDISSLFTFVKERLDELEEVQNKRFTDLNEKLGEFDQKLDALKEMMDECNKEISARLISLDAKQEEHGLFEKLKDLEVKVVSLDLKGKTNMLLFILSRN